MIASYALGQIVNPLAYDTELVIPIVDFNLPTEWGMSYGSCMSYVDNNRYFEKHFDDGLRTAMIWQRYWSSNTMSLAEIPQLSFGGGSGFVTNLNMWAFLYHTRGTIYGNDIDIADTALIPIFDDRNPAGYGIDYRSWYTPSYGSWYNDNLHYKYNSGSTGRYPVDQSYYTPTFSGSWLLCGSSSLHKIPKTVTVYPWALMLFKDITDGDIYRYFDGSATGISIWRSSAKFGFKFYIQPISDPDAGTDKWSWYNIDRPGLTSGELAYWHYKGRQGIARIVAKASKNGHNFTMVKVSSPASGYTLMDITSEGSSISRISAPAFNMGYINNTNDVFDNQGIHATPQPTGIYILESGCEYEVKYFT